MTRKKFFSLWVVCILIFSVFLLNYANNERKITKYKNGEYEENGFDILGFTEPYINDYNQGNICYMQGEYKQALDAYYKALGNNPPYEKECLIRINMALSLVTPIDVKSINKDNIEDTLKTLQDARELLTEHGCAHMDDEGGHNKDAVQLKKEIDDFEKKLMEQMEQEEKKENQEENQGEKEKEEEQQSGKNNEKKKQLLQELQNKSLSEYYEENRIRETINADYSLYDGKTW